MIMGKTTAHPWGNLCHSRSASEVVRTYAIAVPMSYEPDTLYRRDVIHGSTGPTTTDLVTRHT